MSLNRVCPGVKASWLSLLALSALMAALMAACQPQDTSPPAPEIPMLPAEASPSTLPGGSIRYYSHSGAATQSVDYLISIGAHCGPGPIDFDGSFWRPRTRGELMDLARPGVGGMEEIEGTIRLASVDEAVVENEHGQAALTRVGRTFDQPPCA